MLTVHHLGVSQSERIVWLCEELGLDYELKRYDRIPPGSGMGPPEYKALHPLGTAPIITDGEVVLAESAAIMEYILVKYGKGALVVGPDQPNYADYLYWFHFANGTFMPSQASAMYQRFMGLEGPLADHFAARNERLWRLVDDRLGEVPYYAGQAFTAADIIMDFALTTMRGFITRDLSPFPNILAHLQRIGARPGYRRAMEKAEPGMKLRLT